MLNKKDNIMAQELPCLSADKRALIFEESKYRKKLNLGCGNDYLEGYVNLDHNESIKADVYAELDSPTIKLPFADGGFDAIWAAHILEHIWHLGPLKMEMMRILRPYGLIVMIAPHYLSRDAWGDHTHVRAFSEHSFFPQYWPGCKETRYNFIDVTDSLGNKNQWIFGHIKKNHGAEVVA